MLNELRKIFGPKKKRTDRLMDKITNVALHNLYGNADIIRKLKSRSRLRWARYVARMGSGRKAHKFF